MYTNQQYWRMGINRCVLLVTQKIASKMDHLCVHTAVFIGPGRASVIRSVLQHGASDVCACTSESVRCRDSEAGSHYVVTCSESQQLVLYNTPHGSGTRLVLEGIARSSQHPFNVIVACIRVMLSSKPLGRSARVLRVLHETFGQRVWRNVVFVLTSVYNSRDPRKLCSALKEDVRKRICHDVLHGELKVPLEVVDNIAIVPVGFPWRCGPKKSTWVDHLRRSILRTAASSDCLVTATSEPVHLPVSSSLFTAKPQEAISTIPSLDPHQASVPSMSRDPHQASMSCDPHQASVPSMSCDPHQASMSCDPHQASVPSMSCDPHQASMSCDPHQASVPLMSCDPHQASAPLMSRDPHQASMATGTSVVSVVLHGARGNTGRTRCSVSLSDKSVSVQLQVEEGSTQTIASASNPHFSTSLKSCLAEYLFDKLDSAHMCDRWMDLGRELGFKFTEVENIRVSFVGSGNQVCLQALLDRWLNWAPPDHKFPAIGDLITAVRKLGHENLAWKLASDKNLKHNCNLMSVSEHR